MRTIIISDIHLGTCVSRVDDLTSFLSTTQYDELIINGDLIDHLNFNRFKKKHWRLLNLLEKIQPRIIIGNHDVGKEGSELILRKIFGKFDLSHIIDTSAGKYLICHGHIHDPLMNFPLLTETADHVYHLSHKVSKRLARWLKRKSKKVGGFMDFLIKQATHIASKNGCVGTILGHTHHAEDTEINEIHYLNTGCWTGHDLPTYVEIVDGEIPKLRYVGA